MKISTKKLIAFALILTLMFTMCACKGDNKNNQASQGSVSEGQGTSNKKTSVNYGLTGDPASLDPMKTTDQMSRAVWTQMYDTCARKLDDGTYEPKIAESWNVSDDGLKITLNIREGIKFHDGKPLTAEDVAFSLNRLASEPTTAGMMVSMNGESAVAVDDKTCVVTISAPYGAILDVIFIEGRIISKNAVETMGDEGFAQHPIGCGPYKFVERKTGESITLTAFEDYYDGKYPIKDITFKIITDSATAVVALEKGELDFLSHAPLASRQNLIDNQNIEWYETPIAGLVYINFNTENGMFSNKLLRKAIQCGIDKEAMVVGGVEGHGETISTMIPDVCFGYQEDFPDIEYDLDKAKEYMREAGYPDGFKITLITQENATYSKPTQVIQGQLAKLGIEAEIDMMERATFFSTQRSSQFEMDVAHWTTPCMDADYLYQIGHSSMLGQTNCNRINDPEFDAALDKGRTSVDPEERMEAYKRVCEIIQEEAYWVPLYTFMAPCAANKDLKGVHADSLYKFYVSDWSW